MATFVHCGELFTGSGDTARRDQTPALYTQERVSVLGILPARKAAVLAS